MEVPSTLHSCSCCRAWAMQTTSSNWASRWCATFLVSSLPHCAPEVSLLNKSLLYFISMEWGGDRSQGSSELSHCSHEPEGPPGLAGLLPPAKPQAFVSFSSLPQTSRPSQQRGTSSRERLPIKPTGPSSGRSTGQPCGKRGRGLCVFRPQDTPATLTCCSCSDGSPGLIFIS